MGRSLAYLTGMDTDCLLGEDHASNWCIGAVLASLSYSRHYKLVEVCSRGSPSLVCIQCPFAEQPCLLMTTFSHMSSKENYIFLNAGNGCH